MLLKIGVDDQTYAQTLLRWLAYSQTPLSLDEVAEISTIVIGKDSTNNDVVDTNNRGGLEDVLDTLAGLVVTIKAENEDAADENSSLGDVDQGDDDVDDFSRRLIKKDTKIRLAHFSVKEYLESTRIKPQSFRLDPAREHRWITQSCLIYLMHYSASKKKESSEQDLVVFPLLEYAAAMWYRHALLQQTGQVRRETKMLESKTYRVDWLQIHKPEQSWWKPFDNNDYDNKGGSLYYSSFIGLVNVVQALLEANADVNAQGGEYGNALQAASVEGHEKVVQLLLDAKADVNVQGGWYSNALQAGSYYGHEKVVQLLLEAGAEVNARGGLYGNALQAASASGHEKVVQLLLGAKADVNAQGGAFDNALYAASYEGHEKVVQLLLEGKADVNVRGGLFGNALYAASNGGHEKVVQLLLDAKADVNAQGGEYGNALQAASLGGYRKVVQLLIKAEADVNARGGYFGSALQAASSRGHEKVVQLLLRAGAVDEVGEDEDTEEEDQDTEEEDQDREEEVENTEG
jgi:ankyrin repeat protein